MDQKPITDARADLSEVVHEVRLLRKTVMLTRRGTPQAALVPPDVGQAIDDAGGPDAAIKILTQHL